MEANPSIDQGVLGLAWLTHHGSQGPEPGPVHLHSEVRVERGPALLSDPQEPWKSRPGSKQNVRSGDAGLCVDS